MALKLNYENRFGSNHVVGYLMESSSTQFNIIKLSGLVDIRLSYALRSGSNKIALKDDVKLSIWDQFLRLLLCQLSKTDYRPANYSRIIFYPSCLRSSIQRTIIL